MKLGKLDLGHVILIGTLLVSIPRFAAAFSQAEPSFMGMNISPITGIGFGILVEVGTYYIISAWLSAKRRGLKLSWILLAGFIVQLIIVPIIVAPAIAGHLKASNGELAQMLGKGALLVIWSCIVALAPSILLATVAIASYMQQPSSKKQNQKQQKQEAKQEKQFQCSFCDESFASQLALNGHQKKHRKENSKEE